jgi:hypothetical protein
MSQVQQHPHSRHLLDLYVGYYKTTSSTKCKILIKRCRTDSIDVPYL